MRKFVLETGTRPQETVWFSRSCDAFFGQICHILWTFQFALNSFVKGFDRDYGPALQPFSGCSSQIRRHFDPIYGSMT